MQQQLERLYAAHDKLTPFVGSGVSIAATRGQPAASWRGLLESGVSTCLQVSSSLPINWEDDARSRLETGDVTTYIALADEISKRLGQGGDSREFDNWISRTVGSLLVEDDSLPRAVTRLSHRVLTTNYDTILEQCDYRPKDRLSLTWLDTDDIVSAEADNAPFIAHVHGSTRKLRSVILGSTDYGRLVATEDIQFTLQALFAFQHLLFIGCGDGLTDPNIGPLISYLDALLPSKSMEHFLLVRGRDLASAREQRLSPSIVPIAFGSTHDHLAQFLTDLADENFLDISQEPTDYERGASVPLGRIDLAAAAEDLLEDAMELARRGQRALNQLFERADMRHQRTDVTFNTKRELHRRVGRSVEGPARRLATRAARLSLVTPGIEDLVRQLGPSDSPYDRAKFASIIDDVVDLAAKVGDLSHGAKTFRDELQLRESDSDAYAEAMDSTKDAVRNLDDAADELEQLADAITDPDAASSVVD
jgi:hypothetical protein